MTSFFLTFEDKATLVCNISNWIHTEVKFSFAWKPLALSNRLFYFIFTFKSHFLRDMGPKTFVDMCSFRPFNCFLMFVENFWSVNGRI